MNDSARSGLKIAEFKIRSLRTYFFILHFALIILIDMYGYRARIGLIVPSSNTVCEPEMAKLCPEGVATYLVFRPGGRTRSPIL